MVTAERLLNDGNDISVLALGWHGTPVGSFGGT